MAQNITLMGASYSDVPAVQLPKTGGGTARFDDASVTTAIASDVASGKIFLASDGTITTGTNSGGGSASNFVTGTFKGTDAQKGTALNLTLPYTGSGYPIAVVICPTEGAYNSASGSFYNLIQRYAVAQYAMTKSRIDTAPTYGTPGANNYGVVTLIYKSSASSATTYNRGGSMYADSYSSSPATQTNTQIVRFISNNKMSVFIASNNNYGFAAGIEYTYCVIYSE